MAPNLVEKIVADHLVEGEPEPGEEIGLRMDQALLQDATGTLAWLQFEQMDVDAVRVGQATQYVDHNTLQTGYENADDHRFLMAMCKRYGAVYSRPGNGISHWSHMEAYDVPGQTMLGCDSHTPQAGSMGMLAIGAGGLEVAAAMAGEPYRLTMPTTVGVRLDGGFPPWVSAKDAILELLRRHGVAWGKGKVIEFHGPAVERLSVPERGTICNMVTELGATSGLFPSDGRTKAWLQAQGRADAWTSLEADADAEYDEEETIDLSSLEPLIACPHSPGNVRPVSEVAGTDVSQVAIGSSVNSSYRDLSIAAHMLDGRQVAQDLSMAVSPGSRRVRLLFILDGGVSKLAEAGVRELEVACGPCIGMGFAPPSGGASVRTFNRNFKGRSGTPDDQVYLASPETAAASAVTGVITDPRDFAEEAGLAWPDIEEPSRYPQDDSGYFQPAAPDERNRVEIPRGPNIRTYEPPEPVGDSIEAEVLLRLGDDVSTDDILPGGNRVMPYRSNIPKISRSMFAYIDDTFPERADEAGTGIVVAGANYGQGSSREHAAAAPAHLGVRLVVAKDFARIHQDNLVNFGIPPVRFADPDDIGHIEQGDTMRVEGIHGALADGSDMTGHCGGHEMGLTMGLSSRQREILQAGSAVEWLRRRRGG